MQAEGRAPTQEEQDILGQFVGWGQFPALFNDINDAGEQLAEEREELKGLLGERGLRAREGLDYQRALHCAADRPEDVGHRAQARIQRRARA